MKKFDESDIKDHKIVIAATNHKEVNSEIFKASRAKRVLINVADTPSLCDFYMGSIVTKGNLKIAISTNGKSPTFSKRLRQLLEQTIPEESHDLIKNLRLIRDRLSGSFSVKVKELNSITQSLIE